jgi:hypothetical protein
LGGLATVEIPLWVIYVPGVVIVLGGIAAGRWLSSLERRVSNHAERLANLEGRRAERDAGADADDG